MSAHYPPPDAFDSILVPTDGSDAAHAALVHALVLARPYGAAVHVLTVVDPSANPLAFGVEEVDELNRAAQTIVDDLVDAYVDHAVEVHGAVRRGRPHRQILAYADEMGIDLLVVGRTGVHGVSRSLLGSTTDRLIRSSSIPVTVVPSGTGDGNGR